jgi:D-glycero-D-manno-heptose 1,7-bisphosphate phosphatase
VGDSLRDLQAAAAVGADPVLVLTGKGAKTRSAGKLPEGTTVYPDLAAVAHALCR